ncbi:RPM1 interacting protein 13 [Tasmannia lanceolata]|uniref:RPM1 interacting protein 13 n=1 Tax=Tasmannia lanceolata TaxID=3420 RepID=UPI004064BBE8
MGSEPIILEISSDEDNGWDEHDEAPIDWISELLERVDNQAEESDDVVVVDELSCVPSKPMKGFVTDDLDDDCLVLDGDPDKPISVIDNTGDGSDDLLIVGEKGQIACRDYPHPRHLCAKFPFSTTLHEKHCDLCHCYVCDKSAPCAYWATNASSTDHCHSTDKLEIWRIQRKSFKQGNIGAPPIQKPTDTTLSITPPLHNYEPTLSPSGSLGFSSISLRSPLSRSTQVRACSVNNIGKPIPTSYGHKQRSKSPFYGRNRDQFPNISHQLMLGGQNTRKERVGGGTLGPQLTPTYSKFKRVGSSRPAFPSINRSGYCSSNNNQMYTPISPRNQSLQSFPMSPDNITSGKWQEFLLGNETGLDTFQNTNTNDSFTDFHQYTVSSQPLAFSQSLPQPNVNQNISLFENPSPNPSNPNPSDFGTWLNDASQSNPEYVSAADPQLTSVEPSKASEVTQCPQNATGSSDFDFERWISSLEESIPESATNPVLSPLDFAASQAANSDPAMLLYEFENPWGGLAHV